MLITVPAPRPARLEFWPAGGRVGSVLAQGRAEGGYLKAIHSREAPGWLTGVP